LVILITSPVNILLKKTLNFLRSKFSKLKRRYRERFQTNFQTDQETRPVQVVELETKQCPENMSDSGDDDMALRMILAKASRRDEIEEASKLLAQMKKSIKDRISLSAEAKKG
jgi:hypothetical protein